MMARMKSKVDTAVGACISKEISEILDGDESSGAA